MLLRRCLAAPLILAALLVQAATAADRIRTEPVRFAPGAESAVIEGRITGAEIVDYTVGVRAGQHATISLAADWPSPYFNLLPPGGEQGEAVFVGAREGSRFEGTFDRGGDWSVRVYQMGNARDAGETHAFRLEIVIPAGQVDAAPDGGGDARSPGDAAGAVRHASPEDGGPRRWQVSAGGGLRMHAGPSVSSPIVETLADGAILSNLGCTEAGGRTWCDVQPYRGGARGHVAAEFLVPAPGAQGSAPPMGIDDSALRAGRGEFDARAPDTRCARGSAAMGNVCDLGVARAGGGDATVAITFPDGFRRTLFFTHGAFIGADASEAGGGFDTEWSKDAGGTYRIRVDDERYEFPEAVIFGG